MGEAFTFTPGASDPEGDALQFSILNLPGWANFNAQTGELSGLPLQNDVGSFDDILISVSDGTLSDSLPGFSLAVVPAALKQAAFSPEGVVEPNADGYRSIGPLALNLGTFVQRFENADLLLEFNANDDLVGLLGEGDVPELLSDFLAVQGNARAIIGVTSGRDLNADPDLGIRLVDDNQYFVYRVASNLTLSIGDRRNPAATRTVTLEPPLGGEIILIVDPLDPLQYYFGSQPLLGSLGVGESRRGLIPFVPQLPYPALDTFNGHQLLLGSTSLGTRVFDFFEISGSRVVRNPQFQDIDWDAPFDSAVEFRAGLNGDASFALAALGVGVFSFDLAETSATLDVGFDRQSMAMQTVIEPDVSWVPDWFPIVPQTEITGEWLINGDGDFEVELRGGYRSTLPPIQMSGSMRIDKEAVTLTARPGGPDSDLSLVAEFGNQSVTARIDVNTDFAGGIGNAVSDALDRELQALEESVQALENAIADYEFEVSLGGLRSSLPGITDTAVGVINAIPGRVRDSVDSGTVSALRNACFLGVCASSFVNETAIGDRVGGHARAIANDAIVPYREAMEELKRQAQEGDDDALRAALKTALLEVYDRRTFSLRLLYTEVLDFGFGIGERRITLYDRTFTRQVIPADTANQIRDAADNVDRLPQASARVVSGQAVVDSFRPREVIRGVKEEVDSGLADIPSFDGMGYRISLGALTMFIVLNQEEVGVSFNVLDAGEALVGIGEAIADGLLGL
ncbi:hypothetical protein G6032_15090 [Wenzhouxiangella sp. XN24]|nr:hypothetical protein [Wenzhouxiangella sp. XN24]